jgi:hypothetical protein
VAEIGTTLCIDGVSYAVAFFGFDVSMDVRMGGGGPACRLWPWTLGEHFETLASCLRPAVGGVSLAADAYADRVLSASKVPEASRPALMSLALWWASGGAPTGVDPVMDADGWWDLGGPRVRLRPWSAAERFAALVAASGPGEDGRAVFDPVTFLRSMLLHTVSVIDPPTALDDLDSGAAARLVNAAITVNGERGAMLPGSVASSPAVARITLRLCRALGWTPSQVWATPAVELDHLLRLLDGVEAGEEAPSYVSDA